MTCDVTLDVFPGITIVLRSENGHNTDLASLVPVVVIKKLLNVATKVHMLREKNCTTLFIYYPFLGHLNHFRRIYFLKSELIDPFIWEE